MANMNKMSKSSFPYVLHSKFGFLDEEEDSSEDYVNQTNSNSPSKERIVTITITKIQNPNSKEPIKSKRRVLSRTESTISDIPPSQNITTFQPFSMENSSALNSSEFKARKNVKPKPISLQVKPCQEENILNPEELNKEAEESKPKHRRKDVPKSETETQTDKRYLTPRSSRNNSRSSFNNSTTNFQPNSSLMRMSELNTPNTSKKQNKEPQSTKQSKTQNLNSTNRKNSPRKQTKSPTTQRFPQKTATINSKRDKSPTLTQKTKSPNTKQTTNTATQRTPKQTPQTQRSKSPANKTVRKQNTPSQRQKSPIQKQTTPNKEEQQTAAPQNRFVITRQTEAEERPVTVQDKVANLSVVGSVQIDIKPSENLPSPSKTQTEQKEQKDSDSSSGSSILQLPQQTFKKFSPQRKTRTVNKSSFAGSKTRTIEHTQTTISPVKQTESLSQAQKFPTGYLQSVAQSQSTETEKKDETTENQNAPKEPKEQNSDDEFLSPQKIEPIKNDDDSDSISEFLQTEEKLKNEPVASSTLNGTTMNQTQAKQSTYEFIPYEQEKPKRTKKRAQVIPNYSKVLRIVRDFLPDVRRLSLEMSKYKHEHLVIYVSGNEKVFKSIYTLDFDNKLLKRVWGIDGKSIIEEKEIKQYYSYDTKTKKFRPNSRVTVLTQDIEAFSC